METLPAEVESPAASQRRARINHAALLADFRNLYCTHVYSLALKTLNAGSSGRSFCQPVIYTLRHRRNLFRTGFALAMGEAIGNPPLGTLVALTGEIAWSCALVLDDMIDRSSEREGKECAYLKFGPTATALAVLVSLVRTWLLLVISAPARLRHRFRLGVTSAIMLGRCLGSQIPFRRAPLAMRGFMRYARAVNISTHWAVIAPLIVADNAQLLRCAWNYADAISVNGKMRNDLLDYCGGSTESVTLFRDFDSHCITFPIVVLWELPLSSEARLAIEAHFVQKRKSSLSASDFMKIAEKYGLFDRCLELMRRQVDAAHAAIEGMERAASLPRRAAELLRAWTYHQIQLAEERVDSQRGIAT